MDNAQGPSLNRHERETSGDGQADFVPRADVFDTPTQYVIHVSLPGVQKSDVSLDYDSDKSTLHLSGVIHRPEFSEELHEAMIINERYSEVGVFERSIHLGTRFAPVNVDHENMSAKFIDGVLVVRLPKISAESEQSQKKIAVEQDVDTTEENDTKMQKDIETNESDAKHASVLEVPDETESMHVDTETEPGDLLTEAENRSYTPSHDSEEEDLYESIRDEFPKVH
ncbi:hypothetical protein BGW36DRAFT_294092 [Talaromyces proteolyticus]|uniref:SHSP domain-containing protein n=1 Tax=Talaromyces proteolyticus TaxID=1131652 RepID=A0AAD4KXC1_9EURO|nr:uncharacterized protein BGW36DRAFT_294092 [Talaromyces proteolyticus]KAH8698958.1 hypothetical protein BGW36DRAFT_294092 [Talaromyces proteolyticus]